MGWFKELFSEDKKSGNVAKSRLQVMLTHDRTDISPGLLAELKDEIIAVIARRLSIDVDQVEINIDQSGNESRLVAQIPINGDTPRR